MSGWIIFKFFNEEKMSQVLQGGPFLAYGRPLFLKKFPNVFQFNNEELSIVPMWIQLKNLLLELWTLNSLGKICSMLDMHVHANKLTTNRESISYARALVEIDVAKELKYSVRVHMPYGQTFNQEVSYENVPKFCTFCNMLGHAEVNCKNKKEVEQRRGKKKKEFDAVKEPLDGCLDSCKSSDMIAEKVNTAGSIDAVKIGASFIRL
ncbi:uncharacterized protein LOC131153869 [Malania oleifera]|uniref:uncharacterized protein LOC131153869 n=1 Tax=Malania oleifera TaxID=397392 RepID=UPI0025ADAC27|nr:uncharacterized protein LOC131153869 [Malania oleifera]